MDSERQRELLEELEAQLEELEQPAGVLPDPEQLVRLPVCRPEDYSDAVPLAERIRAAEAFVLDTGDLPWELARRILDFLAGAAYLAGATIRRLDPHTYVVTPPEF